MTLLSTLNSHLLELPFHELPDAHRVRVYGTDYARFDLDSGGELYLTRDGWGLSRLVLPGTWFIDQRYATQGRPLEGATGTVYRVPAQTSVGATRHLIVKFSRLAQEVPLFFEPASNPDVPACLLEHVYFNDPFEEFGLVHELRTGDYGPQTLRIRVKKPLAIYSPALRYELWQLGRSESALRQSMFRLQQDQKRDGMGSPVTLHRERDYIVLYQWVKGLDAERMFQKGLLDATALHDLHRRVNSELLQKGFVMLDNKPRHVILRRIAGTDRLLTHEGCLSYALVDFELLKRTPEYETWRTRH